MKISWFHLGIVALFSLALGLFLGSEIRIGVADMITGKYVVIEVEIVAYSSSKVQTSGDPFRTASNLKVTPQDLWQLRYVAISRDLKTNYNLPWGSKIFIEFEIQDLMGKTAQGKIIEKTVDIFMRSQEIALNFGRQKRRIIILTDG